MRLTTRQLRMLAMAPVVALLGSAVMSCGRTVKKESTGSSRLTEAWVPGYGPESFSDEAYERRFDKLPVSGNIGFKPWATGYWPDFRGGLADRWNDPGEPDPFSYSVRTEEEIRRMSVEELAKLSPAEKFDIYNGRFDFPMLKSERNRTDPKALPWSGMCDGTAIGSSLTYEPQAVTLTSAKGIKVPFGSADIQGLVAYYYSKVVPLTSRYGGTRCDETGLGANGNVACRDPNPGVFHILVANEIGRLGRHLLADMTWDYEVWNHAIYSYESVIEGTRAPSPGANPAAVREAVVSTAIWYNALGEYSWNRLTPDKYPISGERFRYALELDARGEIVGGTWLQAEHPDFLWRRAPVPFTGDFEKLREIYVASVRDIAPNQPYPVPVPNAGPLPDTLPTMRPEPQPTPVWTIAPQPTPMVTPQPTPVVTHQPQPRPTTPPVLQPGEVFLQDFVVAGEKGGIYYFDDPEMESNPHTFIVVKMRASTKFYRATLVQSIDGGATWTMLSNGLFHLIRRDVRMALSQRPSPGTLLRIITEGRDAQDGYKVLGKTDLNPGIFR